MKSLYELAYNYRNAYILNAQECWEELEARDNTILQALKDMVETYQYEASSENLSLLAAMAILKENGVQIE